MVGLKAESEKDRVGGRKKGLGRDQKTEAYAALHLTEKEDHKVSDIKKSLKIS